jgi:DNA-binding FrmR family transcriptional regulator
MSRVILKYDEIFLGYEKIINIDIIKLRVIMNTYPPMVGGEEVKMEDRKKAIQNLKIAKGQIEGIIKMIEDERYCVDISNQIIAVQSLLKKANLQILKRHLDHCVKDAILNNNGDEKIDEIMNIFEKISK